jgi:hypothetical protein
MLKMGFMNLCFFLWNPKECQKVFVGDYNIDNSFFKRIFNINIWYLKCPTRRVQNQAKKSKKESS